MKRTGRNFSCPSDARADTRLPDQTCPEYRPMKKPSFPPAFRFLFGALVLACLAGASGAVAESVARTGRYSAPAVAGKSAAAKDEKKPKTIAEVVGSAKKLEGLFTLYQDTTNGAVHLLIKEAQLDREFIYFTHTRDGVLAAGHFRGAFQDTRIFTLRKLFNRIQFVSENTAFYFDPSNALKRAASANISPSVLVSQEIVAEDKAKGEYLI